MRMQPILQMAAVTVSTMFILNMFAASNPAARGFIRGTNLRVVEPPTEDNFSQPTPNTILVGG